MADGAINGRWPAWGGPGRFAAEKRRIERHQREMQRRQAEHLARLKRRGQLFGFWFAALSTPLRGAWSSAPPLPEARPIGPPPAPRKPTMGS